MDEQTRSIFQQLLDLQKSNFADIAALKARAAIDGWVLTRLVAKTDILEGLDAQERETLLRVITASRSMADHVPDREGLDSYIALIEHRLAESVARSNVRDGTD